MKKTLLLAVALVATITISAQKVWNFSNAPYGATPTVVFTSTFTNDDLTVGTDGTALFALTANNKTIDAVAYTYRLQTGGGGAPVAPSKIPTTRFLKFNVSGASTINIGMISSSSSATRTLIIVNSNESVLDSIVNISGSTAATYTYNYTGAASSIYLYSRASGINYYYLSATNVVAPSGIASTFADKGISIQGNEVLNANNSKIEIYNVLGKKVLVSTENVSFEKFEKGMYVVRTEGVKEALKFVR